MKENGNDTLLSFERRQRILEIVNRERTVSVDQVAEQFPVAEITIRRDLDKLAEEGLIKRVHGGAAALSNIVVAPKASDLVKHINEERRRIGREAAKRIHDGEYIYIEAGSTCYALAQSLTEKKNLKIVTVSPVIVMVLSEVSEAVGGDFEIISAGGVFNVYKHFLLGSHTRSLLENVQVDTAFVSVTAIDLEAGITADNLEEAEISRTMLTNSSRRNIGLVVSEKFQTRSFVKVADVQVFEEIITDSGVDSRIVERFQEQGIKISIV
jgi:DeoR/GlpR family transcriptional regulator of sugar metabolism